MTNEEAIKMLKSKMDGHTDTSYEWAETVRMAIKALEQEPCDDAISRQKVQDYIAKYLSQYLYDDVRGAVEVIDEYIGELPPVTPQPQTGHWIPVSERLPEKNDIYVVWTSKGFGDHLSTSYYNTEDGWTIGVCAWKENGEPYKAEGSDKT